MDTGAVPRPHGRFLAAEAGELAGVSGTTIGQWARRGYIRSSWREAEPRVYSLEDVLEAAMVRALLERGVRRAEVRRAIERLAPSYGRWPLSDAVLATAADGERRPRVVLREGDAAYVMGEHGWQGMSSPPPLEEVRLRLRRVASEGRAGG
jgi:hypothetical protein